MNNYNVQRLEGKDLPRVLEDLTKHDSTLLDARSNLIETGKYKGNSKELRQYKEQLPNNLTQEQVEFGVGLALGDTSIEYNENYTACRLKTQQKELNRSLLDLKTLVFKPWITSEVNDVNRQEANPNQEKMLEVDTIKHPAFMTIAKVFQTETPEKGKASSKNVLKKIPSYLKITFLL